MPQTSAIIVAGGRCPSQSSSSQSSEHDPERALACVEVLGESILERTLDRLQKHDLVRLDVIAGPIGKLRGRHGLRVTTKADRKLRWLAATRALEEHARRGIDTTLVAELGMYAEFDLQAALDFHWTRQQTATPLYDNRGPLAWWIVDPARLLSANTLALPFDEDRLPDRPVPYVVGGYTNPLADVHELRQLIVDAFLGRCAIAPGGREIKPGVWVDEGAQVHKSARLVAPAYLGRNSRVHAAAVITRYSNVERDCSIGEGSVVAGSSILPHTTIGAGLDITAALVEGGAFVDFSRNVRLTLRDPLLLASALPAKADHSARTRGHEPLRPSMEPDVDYSYLSRAAGRLLEVFKGEV